MAAPPSPQAFLHLYRSTLRAAKSFSSYNFRNYFLRRTRENFRGLQAEQDAGRLSLAYTECVRELDVLRRCAVVNQVYAGGRLAVEQENGARGR